MNATADELRSMERLHVKAWPAFETADIDGWLWRYSGGGSLSANSVSTIDFNGADPEAALDQVESRYRAKGASVRVNTFDAGAPPGLTDILEARRYRLSATTATMLKPVVPGAASWPEVEANDRVSAEWLEVYLAALAANRRAVNTQIVETVPAPRQFFACRREGRVISTALAIIDGGMAAIECVATRLEARGQRGAEAVLRAIECWAASNAVRMLGLQVVIANQSAIALYHRLGFASACINKFWERE